VAYALLDDQLPDHPKIVSAGPLAGWLYVCGLAYCTRLLTDGFIPTDQVRRLTTLAAEEVTPLVTRLLEVGLWEEAKDGYRVHDFDKHNPTAADVKAKRAAAAKRQAEWKARHLGTSNKEGGNGVSNALPPRSRRVSNGAANGVTNSAPRPSHESSLPTGESADAGASVPPEEPWKRPLIEAFAARGMPFPILNQIEGNHAKTLCRRHSVEAVADCWQAVAAGEYGDPNGYDQRKLSFAHLNHAQFLANFVHSKNGTYKPPQRAAPPPKYGMGAAKRAIERSHDRREQRALTGH
jgi:hypothetical protein